MVNFDTVIADNLNSGSMTSNTARHVYADTPITHFILSESTGDVIFVVDDSSEVSSRTTHERLIDEFMTSSEVHNEGELPVLDVRSDRSCGGSGRDAQHREPADQSQFVDSSIRHEGDLDYDYDYYVGQDSHNNNFQVTSF